MKNLILLAILVIYASAGGPYEVASPADPAWADSDPVDGN